MQAAYAQLEEFANLCMRSGEGMADLYQALQPHLDEVAAQRATTAQQDSPAVAADPEELTLAVMGLPNVVR